MKGLFIPEITAEMFRNGCLESIEALMEEGEIYDIDYSQWVPVTERLPEANEEDENGFTKAYLVQDARWMDVAWWDGKFWIAWGYGTVLENVIAWCPLPEPYQEV